MACLMHAESEALLPTATHAGKQLKRSCSEATSLIHGMIESSPSQQKAATPSGIAALHFSASAGALNLDDASLDDLAGLCRWLALGDLVDMFHAGDDLAPDGVLVVEIGHGIEADEELAVAAVRIG